MDILQINKNGLFLDTLEQFYIYANTKSDTHLNDIYSDTDNPIYDVLLTYTSQQHNTVDSTPIQSTFGTTAQVGRDIDTKLYT
jgi:hypothetical protein